MDNGNAFLRAGFKRAKADGTFKSMTIGGTIIKTIFLLIILLISFSYTWNLLSMGRSDLARKFLLIGVLGIIIVAIVTCFLPRVASITSIIYAILEGLTLGTISYYAEVWYSGVVLPAIMLSIATAFAVVMIYKVIGGVNFWFRRIIKVAVMGVLISYLLTFLLSLVQVKMPFIHSGGTIGVVVSLVVMFIAASSLLLCFDFINNISKYGTPKYMEWFGSFSVLVNFVWMYLQILELLEKLKE